jgi:hypothetical protein
MPNELQPNFYPATNDALFAIANNLLSGTYLANT